MQRRFDRSGGLLLHPTSLPDGRLDRSADDLLAFLRSAGLSWWQMLPIVPADSGGSPYRSISAFAGDPRLFEPSPSLPNTRDGRSGGGPHLHAAGGGSEPRGSMRSMLPGLTGIHAHPPPAISDSDEFQRANRAWLDDFALFVALKEETSGAAWTSWPEPLRRRDPAALVEARRRLAPALERVVREQAHFDRRWREFKGRCERAGVRLMGDVPIFVAHDSADVWAHPELFRLDPDGRPEVVTGVPPDYFNAEGQHWGNPHYRWGAPVFAWWIERLGRAFSMFDAVRLDHFLGFLRAWEIPATATSAKDGRYVAGPGAAFFDAVTRALPDRRLLAEDLGLQTAESRELRDAFGLPGMHVLQFSFGDDAFERPHRFAPNSAVYTGTHDNDTAAGWARDPNHAAEVERMRRYFGGDDGDSHWRMICGAWATVCDLAIAPAQDLLGLGSEARMNRPGVATGNWRWRMERGALTPAIADRLRDLTQLYGR